MSAPQTDCPQGPGAVAQALEVLVRSGLDAAGKGPLMFGLCGAQGSGKSTAAEFLRARFQAEGVRTVVLSLDDIYLPRQARHRLAERVHPLLATRGPPGTHDVALGLGLLDQLAAGETVRLPHFDKANDDRAPEDTWELQEGPIDLVVFEGWCVGARPQAERELIDPINELERQEDPDGRWRRWVNDQLAGAYQDLFARVDILALLAAPDFRVVAQWRTEQEHALAKGATGARVMSDAAVADFVQHYERITCHVLGEMPARADLVVRLDQGRRVTGVTRPERPNPH